MKNLYHCLFVMFALSGLGACEMVQSVDSQDEENKPAHHTESGFKNPHIGPIGKGAFEFVRMKYFGDEPFADQEKDAHLVERVAPDLHLIHSPKASPVVTWIGHSTFLIQYRGINILTDPIFSERASPISFAGPKRLVDLPLQVDDLPEIHYVVISHNHYDHLDTGSVRALADSQFIVPLKLGEWFTDMGIDPRNIYELDWWDQQSFGPLTLTATPSQHWSARSPFDRNETLWAAWHMQIADFSVWFAGDTGYNEIQFREVGQRFKTIDLGLIPIGAYAPRWFMGPQHVNPEEAVKIHQDIGASLSFGMHWGTFQLTAEPMMQPKERLALALAESNIDSRHFRTLAIGQTLEVDIR